MTGDRPVQPRALDDRGEIAVIFPAQHLRDRAGAADVLRQQRDWLEAHGYPSRLILIAPRLSPWPSRRIEYQKEIVSYAESLGFRDIDMVGIRWNAPGRWMSILRLATASLRRDWSLDTDMTISEVVDADVARLRRSTDPCFVICNYLSGLSVADALAPRDRQLLILHDWSEGRPSRRVLNALRTNRHRLALNHEEARRITKAAPQKQCLVGIPFDKIRYQTISPSNLAPTAGAAIEMAGPELRLSNSPDRVFSNDLTGYDKPIDLLFVGGAHEPNRAGISAFIRDCFSPFLASCGVNLVVAGSAGDHLMSDNMSGVLVTGRVRDLRPLYASARLVIVPLLSGTGISIKTLEAIAMGKPVLATPVGLRGLDADENLALAPPFDERWANCILSLLGNIDLLSQHKSAMLALVGDQSLGTMIGKVLDGGCARLDLPLSFSSTRS